MRTTILLLTVLFAGSACARNPADDVTAAQTGEAVETPEQPEGTTAESLNYDVTPDNSDLEFIGSNPMGEQRGTFNTYSGTFVYNQVDLTRSSLSIDIDMRSVQAGPDRLTEHLRTSDFFAVDEFPEGHFVTTSIAEGGADGATHTVTGNLTMRGQTNSITFPATLAVTDSAITANASFAINRHEWGVSYPGGQDNLIRDEAVLNLSLNIAR